jgi:hypothetical protein
MSAIAPSVADSVSTHVPCLGCGYDLYASKRVGQCPECGRDVSLSVSVSSVFHEPANALKLRKMGSALLVSSIFAGLCPAACLLAVQAENLIGAVAMTIAFGTCAVFAARAEMLRRGVLRLSSISPVAGPPLVADAIAAGGLLLINLAAYVYVIARMVNSNMYFGEDGLPTVLVGVGFFLLFVTAWRAMPTWRAHADIAHLLGGQRLAKLLHFLSWAKAVYESVWLFCCWTPFALVQLDSNGSDLAVSLAVGALFGLFGFAVIWILMIIAHAIFSVQLRKATQPAIDHTGSVAVV